VYDLNAKQIAGKSEREKADRRQSQGQKRQAPPPKPARSNMIDLVAALTERLAQKKPRKRGAARRRSDDQIRRHLSRPPPSTLRTRSTWMAESGSGFLTARILSAVFVTRFGGANSAGSRGLVIPNEITGKIKPS
jgi:hypothetical protein